jgi:hypothetical protein
MPKHAASNVKRWDLQVQLTIELNLTMRGRKDDVEVLSSRFKLLYEKVAPFADLEFEAPTPHVTTRDKLANMNTLAVEHFEHFTPAEIRFLDDEPEVVCFGDNDWSCNVTIHCDQIPIRDIEDLSAQFPFVVFVCDALIWETDDWTNSVPDVLTAARADATCSNGTWLSA